MGRVVRAVFKCENSYKAKFSQSQCLITISVGQDSHEGEKFGALVELINNSFKSCIMIIDDSLQRHTMALSSEKNSDFFYPLSIKEGNTWLLRHKKIIKNFSILKKIIRWDAWLNHSKFLIQKNEILHLIATQDPYRKAFETAVEDFLEKYCRRKFSKSFNINRAEQLCFDFVVEECAALSLWPELQCRFEVYPSNNNLAMDETRKYFIFSQDPELLQSIKAGFKDAPQLRPQRFIYLEQDFAFI